MSSYRLQRHGSRLIDDAAQEPLDEVLARAGGSVGFQLADNHEISVALAIPEPQNAGTPRQIVSARVGRSAVTDLATLAAMTQKLKPVEFTTSDEELSDSTTKAGIERRMGAAQIETEKDVPVIKSPEGLPPITPEMVQRALAGG